MGTMLNGDQSTALPLPIITATFSPLGATSGRVDRAPPAAQASGRAALGPRDATLPELGLFLLTPVGTVFAPSYPLGSARERPVFDPWRRPSSRAGPGSAPPWPRVRGQGLDAPQQGLELGRLQEAPRPGASLACMAITHRLERGRFLADGAGRGRAGAHPPGGARERLARVPWTRPSSSGRPGSAPYAPNMQGAGPEGRAEGLDVGRLQEARRGGRRLWPVRSSRLQRWRQPASEPALGRGPSSNFSNSLQRFAPPLTEASLRRAGPSRSLTHATPVLTPPACLRSRFARATSFSDASAAGWSP